MGPGGQSFKAARLLVPVGQQSWVEYKMLANLYQEDEARQTKGRMESQVEVLC